MRCSQPLPCSRKSLPLGDIEAAVRSRAAASPAPSPEDKRKAWLLKAVVDRLRADGQTQLPRPWPYNMLPQEQLIPTDASEGQVQAIAQHLSAEPWAMYAPKGLLLHAHIVYLMALQAYAEMVAIWLPSMAHRMSLSVLMPVNLAGMIGMPPEPLRPHGLPVPIIGYTLAPADERDGNSVQLTLGSKDEFDRDFWPSHEQLMSISEEIGRKREADKHWLHATAHSEVLGVFGYRPATDLARKWLCADLTRIGWFRRPKELHLEVASSSFRLGEDGIYHVTLTDADLPRDQMP